jgi:hypothetical protein
MNNAFGIVQDGQMPTNDPPGDLRATGQEEEAREFLAPVPPKLAGFQFDDLLSVYPQGSPEQAKQTIGGHADEAWIGNTCSMRISRVLNYSGVKVPNLGKDTLAVVSGSDHLWYSFRQKELRAWFSKHFGKPSLSFGKSPDRRKLWNLKGFIGFDINFSDATGHFDLWDGKNFQLEAQATHDYFALATRVDFWRVPSWKRP